MKVKIISDSTDDRVIEVETCKKCGALIIDYKWTDHINICYGTTTEPAKDDWLPIHLITGRDMQGAEIERDYIAKRLKYACEGYHLLQYPNLKSALQSLFRAAGL